MNIDTPSAASQRCAEVLFPVSLDRRGRPKAVMLITLLPYIETAEHDESYKPGAIRKLVSQLRELITKTTGDLT